MQQLVRFIEDNYNLDKIISIIKMKNVYKLDTESSSYALKIINNNDFESNLKIIENSGLEYFVPLIYNKNSRKTTNYKRGTLYLTKWVDGNKDYYKNKINTLIRSVLDIHLKTAYAKKIDEDFLKKELNYINKSMISNINIYESFAREFEVKEFRNPFEWHFLMNYHRIYEVFKIYNQSIEKYREHIKEDKNMIFTIIHGKPTIEHLLESEFQKHFISIDNIKVSIPVFDIAMIFTNYADIDIEWNNVLNEVFNYYNNKTIQNLFFIITSWLLIDTLDIHSLSLKASSNSLEIYTNFLKKISSLISFYKTLVTEQTN